MAELPKTYDPNSVEPKWYAHWLDRGYFKADAHSPKPAFSIVIPPPNITGVLTMGHVLNNTIQDILARRARMLGHEVLWLPGTDHAGVATQTAVEKHLRKTEKKTKADLGREEFLRRVVEWQDKHGGIIIEQLKRLGCSCDWSRQRYTFDDDYVRAVQQVFVDLHAKGLIYRGRRMINWDPVALTALSDEEVIPTKQKGSLYFVRYELVEEPGRFLEVATTRPETIMADVALAVHPNDARYQDLLGKLVWRPLAREKLPIIGDDVIDPEFGTGVLKVTPAHDIVDFEIGQRHGLPVIDVLHPDGRINCPAVPELDGLDRFEARKKAAELLAERGLLAKEEPHENNVGFSERAGVPIEPRLSEQWFLRYPKTDEALAVVREHLIRFFPAHWEKVYAQWLTNIRDWCISRQIWWGHRIPAWYRDVAQVSNLSAGQGSKLETCATFRGFDDYADVDISRRNLPHRQQEGATYFVTFRLADSLPQEKLSVLEVEREVWLAHHPEPWSDRDRREYSEKFSRQIEEWLDAGHGSCVLREDALAELVQTALKHFDGERYQLHAWVVMPNHVHVLVTPNGESRIGEILHSWKRFTTLEINRLTGGSGQLWQHESYDHLVRDEEDFDRIAEYIEQNPAKAGIDVAQVSNLLRKGEQVENLRYEAGDVRVQIESPGEGWTQDTDTLDTWFSSWLWAYETMDAETRAKFYPTSVLVTAPDIIFFWVARMIIAGLEFRPGKSESDEANIPFRDVYFTGLIRDRSGRKMSKSLGNSPDPLDLIAKYGADGLRFGLMKTAPTGQDIRFDEKQVEEGRNFATKLWNAARLRQMHGGESEGEINPALLTSDDKWILLRLDAAITEVSRAFDEYNFSEAAQTLYRFFWGEYCDWYLEASKAALGSPVALPANGDAGHLPPPSPEKTNTLAVMDFVLAHTLRLFHPFLPFITEELWHGLGFNTDLPDGQGGETINYARWPQPLGDDFKAHYRLTAADEEFVAAKQSLVLAGRKLRSDYNIASNKRVRFILARNAEALPDSELKVIQQLLNASALDVPADYSAPQGTPSSLSSFGVLYMPLEGLVDKAAEAERLEKEITKIEAELQTVRRKLSNESFVNGAPAAVVAEHRKRESDFAERLAELQRMRDALG